MNPTGVLIASGRWGIDLGVDDDGDAQVRAITENPGDDLRGAVDAVEHRFLLGEDDETGDKVAVYMGACLHQCRTEEGADECERFSPLDGQVDEEDVPEAVEGPIREVFEAEVRIPPEREEDEEDYEMEGVTALSDVDPEPDTDPGGMYQ